MAKIDFDDAKAWVSGAVSQHGHALTQALASRYGVGRSAAVAAIQKLEKAGLIRRTGAVNRPVFVVGANLTLMQSYSLKGLNVSEIWQRDFAPFLSSSLSVAQSAVLEAGFIAIAGNASLHSQGNSLHVVLEQDATHIELTLHDNGIGLFKQFCQTQKNHDLHEAVKELSLQSAKNPGKGIAVPEKSFDFFLIEANGVQYPADAAPAPLSSPEEDLFEQGTTVIMELSI